MTHHYDPVSYTHLDVYKRQVQQMEADHQWYRSLSAEDRSWVGLVAQAGLSSFLEWFGGEQIRPAVTADVFGTAPVSYTHLDVYKRQE